MKKILFAVAIAASFAACKGKTDTKLDSNKDLILLTDSSRGGSYLTDTGVVATAAARNADNVTPAPAPTRNTGSNAGTSNNNSGSSSNSGTVNSGGSNNSGTTTTTTAPEKKGISKAAKGAIIGGVGGAVIGGVAGKNAKGAIIGGAVGAAGGYIIGRSKDKKDGRVQ